MVNGASHSSLRLGVRQTVGAALFLAGCLVVLALRGQPASAQGGGQWTASYRARSGRGRPDVLVLSGQVGTAQATLYVYDRDGDLLESSDWMQILDYEDDLWVFDVGDDGVANLIIDFYRHEGALLADLYDDQDGVGGVAFDNARLKVLESRYPTIRVTAPDGWWTRGERVNSNVNIEIDGPVVAAFAVGHLVERHLASDGVKDYVIRVRDTDLDGRPDWELVQFYLPLSDDYPYVRTTLIVNEGGNEPELSGGILWPYITGQTYGFERLPGRGLPPIQIDWSASKIKFVGEFVAGRGNDSSWFIYSISRFGDRPDRSFADFENPFGFYDLAGDQDRVPELIIRHSYFRVTPGPDDQEVAQQVRYSWDQDNDGGLDYKLGLFGNQAIRSTLSFDQMSVDTLAYSSMPYQVTRQPWQAATFVAVEPEWGRYGSSEGIYEWDITESLYWYITGRTTDTPPPNYGELRTGLRAEYDFRPRERLLLYIGEVDRKLHLLAAQGGVRLLAQDRQLRYADLDGDGYVDQWIVTRLPPADTQSALTGREQAEKSLQVACGFVLCWDGGVVRLVRADLGPSLYDAPPPRSKEEWLALGQALERYRPGVADDDLLGMAAQFAGPTVEIEGATVQAYRLTADGFRFVLNLGRGFRVIRDDLGLDVEALAEGPYVVSWAGAFAVEPLTPPSLRLARENVLIDPPAPSATEWITVKAVLRNAGLQDVESLPVRIYASHEGGRKTLIADTVVSVFGRGERVVTGSWMPREAGLWRIAFEIDTGAAMPVGVLVDSPTAVQIEVGPAPMPDMFQPLAPYSGPPFTLPVALMLGSAVLALTSVLGATLHRIQAQPGSGGDDRQ